MKRLLKFFRKNQKKFLAILCVLGMVSFISSLAGPGGFTQLLKSGPLAGTIAGKNVPLPTLTNARQEWGMLNSLRYTDPNQPGEGFKFVPSILGDPGDQSQAENPGEVAFAAINKDNRAFFLLLQEAHSHGFTVSPDAEEVKGILQNHIDPGSVTADEQDYLGDAVADLLSVRNWIRHATDVIKVTRPYRRMVIASRDQEIELNLVSFPAIQYVEKVPAPTADQIQKQYDSFKFDEPGKFGSAENPLGFGYTAPQRWKIQYIALPTDELRRAAKASKSTDDWYIAAFARFKAERDHYDGQPVAVPSTQPDSATTQLASTMPSTSPSTVTAVRKADDLTEDFKLHVQLVLEDLYTEETNNLRMNAYRKISDALNAGFGTWRDAQSSGATTLPAAAADYASADFLVKLALSIQTQFGVLPSTSNIDQFKTVEELADIPGLGKSTIETSNTSMQNVPFWRYVPALSLLQPANATIDGEETLYMARISGIETAHVQALDEVKDRVTDDWKLAQAYDTALKNGNEFLADAKTKGFRPAAAAAGFGTPINSGPFFPQMILAGSDDSALAALKFKPESKAELAAAAEQLVTTEPAPDGRPISLAELHADADVLVIQLAAAFSPMGDESGFVESQVVYQTVRTEKLKMLQDFCDYDAVAQRVNFVPEKPPATVPSDQN
jgi:hypothetical protein